MGKAAENLGALALKEGQSINSTFRFYIGSGRILTFFPDPDLAFRIDNRLIKSVFDRLCGKTIYFC
jgi:hypothetical protein